MVKSSTAYIARDSAIGRAVVVGRREGVGHTGGWRREDQNEDEERGQGR